MKYVYLQESGYDCGLACIKMLLAHYHNNKLMLELDKEIVNQRYSLYHLKNYAAKYNLITEGVKMNSYEEITTYQNSIIQIKINSDNHFAIFEKKKGKYYYLVDPNIGRIKLTEEEFSSYFTLYALIVKEVKKYDKKIEKFKFDYVDFSIAYIIFLALDFGLLFMISYLGNDSQYLFHSFLVILSLILSILCKIKLINRHQNKIDDDIREILKNKANLSRFAKKSLLEFKASTIKYKYGKINTIFIIIFILFILACNSLYFLIIGIGIGLLVYVLSKTTLIRDNTLIYKIRILEEKYLSKDGTIYFNELITTSHKYQNIKSNSLVISQSIIMIFITIINNYSEINSFEFVVFSALYICMLISKFSYLFKDLETLKLEYKRHLGQYQYLNKLNKNIVNVEEIN